MPADLDCVRDDAGEFCDMLNAHIDLIRKFDVACVDFISGFPNTRNIFFSSDKDPEKRIQIIEWMRSVEYVYSKNLHPIQLNLLEPDYEDNATLRPYVFNEKDKEIKTLLDVVESVLKSQGEENAPRSCTQDARVEGIPIVGLSSGLAVKYIDDGAGFPIDEQRERLGISVAQLVGRFIAFKESVGDGCRYAYFIPYGSRLNKDRLSGTFLVSCTKLSLFDLQVIKDILTRLFSTIEIGLQTRRTKVASLKSAISSIMSRNGSHNIGSHVLAALSHNVGTMPDDRVLYQYIQHRMDYIATVTTDFPAWSQPTMFVGSMVKNFLTQRHLLNHIAGSEGLKAWQYQNPNIGKQSACVRLHVRKIEGGICDENRKVVADFFAEAEHKARYAVRENLD